VTAVAVLLALPGSAGAQAELPGLFLLPVRTERWSGSWLGPSEPRVLEARLATALSRARRVRPLGARDLPADARAALPRDLATCVTPACLQVLGKASGAERVLALEVLDEGPGPVLFATLYDAADGRVVDQRELPRGGWEPATRSWADEVARWVVRAPGPPVPPRERDPRIAIVVGPQQAGRPEAQALRGELAARLAAAGVARLAWDGEGGEEGPATYRALITVDGIAVSERLHHVHRYRHGVLTATLTVANTRTGAVILNRRDAAELTDRSDRIGNQRMVEALVDDVVSRWLLALKEPLLDQLTNGQGEP
jgi:hypothetical protein